MAEMKLWAVVIGEKGKNSRYICYRKGTMELAIFENRNDAREERKKCLISCGYKSVHVIPFESK